MRGSLSFQRTAAVTAIVSGPLAYSNMILGMMAVDFNFEVFETCGSRSTREHAGLRCSGGA